MNRTRRTGLVTMAAMWWLSVGLAADKGAAHPKQVARSVPRPALTAPPSQYHALPRVDTLLVAPPFSTASAAASRRAMS